MQGHGVPLQVNPHGNATDNSLDDNAETVEEGQQLDFLTAPNTHHRKEKQKRERNQYKGEQAIAELNNLMEHFCFPGNRNETARVTFWPRCTTEA